MKTRAADVSAAEIGARIRFTTRDDVLIEDELIGLHVERYNDEDSQVVLFRLRHVSPSDPERFALQGGDYFHVNGSSPVEFT